MSPAEIVSNILNEAYHVRQKYRRLHPSWIDEDSPLKYVDKVLDDTIQKSFCLAGVLASYNPCRILELGPGTGYLMYILQNLYNLSVDGVCDNVPLYWEMYTRLRLAVEMCRITQVTLPNALIAESAYIPRYDIIVATQISWMDDWLGEDFCRFLDKCLSRIDPMGFVCLFPNPKALQREHTLFHETVTHNDTIVLPHLGTGYIYRSGHQ